MCIPVKTLRACRQFCPNCVWDGNTLKHSLPLIWGAEVFWLSSWAEPGFLVHVQNGNFIEITNAEKQEALCTKPLHKLLRVLFTISEQSLLPG